MDLFNLFGSIIVVLTLSIIIMQYFNNIKGATEDRQLVLNKIVYIKGLLTLFKDLAEKIE